MHQKPVIIFVCEHGAAKSILAAAFFNRLVSEKGLRFHAIARGTHPDAELSSKTVAGLRGDGLAPAESSPIKLGWKAIESARRIVSFCDLPDEYHQKVIVERWDNIPPVIEDYQKARDAIVTRLHKLIEDL